MTVVPPIEIHDLTVSYHRRPVLWNVDVSLPRGGLIGIIGPNGAGKSTLIKAIMGLVRPDSGQVLVNGETLSRQRQAVGYVPQRESVDWDFPVTVRDVVLMGTYGKLGWFRRCGSREHQIADAAIAELGLAEFAGRQISELSGGQRQRVFLARAIAQQADIYLLDEPFAGIDAATQAEIVTLLRRMHQQGRTIVVVHHDLQTAAEYFSHIMLLNMRLVAFGPTSEVFTTPKLQATYSGRLTILTEAAEQLAGARR